MSSNTTDNFIKGPCWIHLPLTHHQKGLHRVVPSLAMPVYAIGITPLLELIKPPATETDVAFADDLGGAGDLITLRRCWDNIVLYGPKLGYNPNAAKSWLVVKPHTEACAREVFEGTKIKITT